MRDATAGKALDGLGEPGVEDPVHPHPDRELLFGGLDVDVGGARVDGLGEQVVHELDDGRLLRHLPELAGAVARVEVLDRPLLPDEVEEPVDLVVGGEAQRHPLAGVEVVEGRAQGVVEDVAGDAAERLVPPPHQHRVVEEPVELDRRLGHELVHVEAVREVFRASEMAGALLLGEPLEEHVLGDGPGPDKERPEAAPDRALDLERLVDVGLLDVVPLHEELVEALCGCRTRPSTARRRFRPLVHPSAVLDGLPLRPVPYQKPVSVT